MTSNPLGFRPVIAIVGQTASGKSELAMRLAEKYDGEIIAADSRTIYAGMDIGTAKPSVSDRRKIMHHGLDLITPDQVFSAAEFKRYAQSILLAIQKRGKLPIIAGGTGLYIDGLLYDFEFGTEADQLLRDELDSLSLEDLSKRASELGITEEMIDHKNRRHLTRALERGGMITSRRSLPKNVLIIGLQIEKATLDERIEQRVDTMIVQGFENEVQELAGKYGLEAPGFLAPGYRSFIECMQNRASFDEAKQEFIRRHKKLAKRQKTWFKRNPDIVWVQDFTEADMEVKNFLSKFATIEQ